MVGVSLPMLRARAVADRDLRSFYPNENPIKVTLGNSGEATHRSSARSEGWRALRNGSRQGNGARYHLAARATLHLQEGFQSGRFHRVRGVRQIPLADTSCDRSDFGGIRRGLQALGVCRTVKPFNADAVSDRIWGRENSENKA
jgi:hypothetical protein